MRRSIAALALSGVLLASWQMPSLAQQQGIVIQNNGVDSSDSAAGADNVSISNNPGSGQSLSGGGVNNVIGTVERQRERKDRGARNNNNVEAAPAEEYVAPAEEYVAPTEGEYQAYAEGTESVEPVAAPEQIAAEAPAEQVVLKLPSTGVGSASSLPLVTVLAGFVASTLGTIGLRRRQTG